MIKGTLTQNGIVVINKPKGMTSHDVVVQVRRKFGMKRVGHAGTLDPLATGVLVILLGKSTRLFPRFEAFDKAYRTTLILGTKTTTADVMGKVLETLPYDHLTRAKVEEVLETFLGPGQQVPPMVSAIKFKGRRLYELARKGIEVERQPRPIVIHKLSILEFNLPRVSIYLECSKGTYVRKLAEDIGEKLGNAACICEIERTKVGPFSIAEAVALEDLNEQHIQEWR